MVLLVVQVPSLLVQRSGPELARRLSLVTSMVDVAVSTTLVVVLATDPQVQLWPILVVPILGSALRFGRDGALVTWAVVAGLYTANSVRLLSTRPDPSTWIANIPYASGLLLLVALGVASMAASRRRSDMSIGAWQQRLLVATTQLSGLLEDDEDAMWTRALRIVIEASNGSGGTVLVREPSTERWREMASVGPAHDAHHPAPGPDERSSIVQQPDGRQLLRLPVADHALIVVVGADLHRRAAHLALFDLIIGHLEVAVATRRTARTEARQVEQLRDLDERKDDFLSILAHELRGPMTVVSGNAILLQEHSDHLSTDHQQTILATIRASAGRLDQLLADTTDALKADRTELPVALRATDVQPIVASIASSIVSQSAQHELVLTATDDLPSAFIDPERLRQVLHNLVDNAVKYSPEGGAVTIATDLDGDRVRIEVRDEGIGIPVGVQDRLFGRFERLHRDLAIPGSGIGLHLTRALVTAMGGSIDVESDAGAGSTFTVSLPVAEDDPPADRFRDHGEVAGHPPQ